LPGGTGAGPAVWCHGLLHHAFRGSYGGYALPLNDRRPDVAAPNLAPALLASLGAAYGEAVAAEDLFDAILCLLSATSYTLRFAEDLEDVFPHVPFPARVGTFREAVRVGREIRAVETFEREPSARPPGFVQVVSEPRGGLAASEIANGEVTLGAEGSGRVTGIPASVWGFAVSGYRVVPRWLEGRRGLPCDLELVTSFRDLCARVAELLDLFAAADMVLEATLHDTLSREALGLPTNSDGGG
jgi:hypothetical protein